MPLEYFESELRMIPGVYLPIRSTLAKTSKGSILISPIKFTDQQIQHLKNQNVTDIVAPNLLHHLFARPAKENLPTANLWHCPGLEEKRKNMKWDKDLGKDLWPHAGEFEITPILGIPRLNEYAFFHKESRSLILIDLAFNLTHPKGFLAPIVFRLMGTYKKFACSQMVKKAIQDQAAFDRSIQQILKWDFDRIVPAHGDIIETGGKENFKKAFGK